MEYIMFYGSITDFIEQFYTSYLTSGMALVILSKRALTPA
jgi:hypothetical protein